GLYDVVGKWEEQQERLGRLSRVGFDICYIRYLVYTTMILGAPYVATGLGCRLYRYSPNQIGHLVAPIFRSEEPRYFRKRIDRRFLKQRFPQLNPKSVRDTSSAERSFVCRLLGLLAPWDPSHPNNETPRVALFAQSSPSPGGELINREGMQ